MIRSTSTIDLPALQVRFARLRSCFCEGIRQYRVDLVDLHKDAVVAPLRANDLQVDAEQVGELGLLVRWIESVGVH